MKTKRDDRRGRPNELHENFWRSYLKVGRRDSDVVAVKKWSFLTEVTAIGLVLLLVLGIGWAVFSKSGPKEVPLLSDGRVMWNPKTTESVRRYTQDLAEAQK